jgi:hypothetical protein
MFREPAKRPAALAEEAVGEFIEIATKDHCPLRGLHYLFGS